MYQIEVYNLTKVFKKTKGFIKKKREDKIAVNNINFTVKKGQIFSLLGPNGAGKTTTVKMLSTLLIPTSGKAYINGKDIVKDEKQVKKIIGTVLPGERTLFWKLTVKENLQYFGALYGLTNKFIKNQIDFLLNYFDIKDKGNELIEKLSTGLRQRVVLARALLPDPEVILLDEPTLGLDPNAAKMLRKMILNLKNNGKTILLTTHYMQEADELSDLVAIIDNGKIIAMDTPINLKRGIKSSKEIIIETTEKNLDFENNLKKEYNRIITTNFDSTNIINYKIPVINPDEDFNKITCIVNSHKIKVSKIMITEPSLEDVFIKLTGKQIKENTGEAVH